MPDFIQSLQANDLLESFVLDVERPDGSHGQLLGFFMINEDKLAALSPETVGLLHEAGRGEHLYGHCLTRQQNKLIRRKLARDYPPMLERNDISAQALPLIAAVHSACAHARAGQALAAGQAAQQSDRAYCDYLRGFGGETRLGLWRAPEANGRFFCSADCGFSFQREISTFGALLDELLASQDNPQAPGLYLALPGSMAPSQACVPRTTCTAFSRTPLVGLWLGNRARVATLRPARQRRLRRLGASPLLIFRPIGSGTSTSARSTAPPAGQPISLVDAAAPDFDRFPRYRGPMSTLRLLRWNRVTPSSSQASGGMASSLGRINTLVNFWWKQSPAPTWTRRSARS